MLFGALCCRLSSNARLVHTAMNVIIWRAAAALHACVFGSTVHYKPEHLAATGQGRWHARDGYDNE